jgi:hypothetical protein
MNEPHGLHLLTAEQRWYLASTYTVLEKLEREGFPYKRLVEVDPGGEAPGWQSIDIDSGRVRLGNSANSPGVIAHEMGHGFHERWRDTPRYGEDFANAIRWFAEQIAGPTSWCDRILKSDRNAAILRLCDSRWDSFLALLRLGERALPSSNHSHTHTHDCPR